MADLSGSLTASIPDEKTVLEKQLLDERLCTQAILNYDPYIKPANLELALAHAKARKVYKYDPKKFESEKVCPCCGFPLEEGEPISITAGSNAIFHLGVGYALYLEFFKLCVILLCVIFCLSSGYGLVSNYLGDGCQLSDVTNNPFCIPDLIMQFSIANSRNNLDVIYTQNALHLLATIGMIIFINYMRYHLKKIEIKADEDTITPSDFANEFTGMPTKDHELCNDERLKNFLEGFSEPGHKVEVVNICRGYDIMHYAELKNRLKELSEEEDKLKEKKEDASEVSAKIKEIKYELLDLASVDPQKLKLSDKVFVSFATSSQAFFIRGKLKRGRFGRVYCKLRRVLFQACCKERFTFQPGDIEVKRAPEPTDIEWQNLAIHTWTKLQRRLKIFGYVLIIVALSFGIILGISSIQIWVVTHQPVGDTSPWVTVLNLFASASLGIMDPVVGLICIALTRTEGHATRTNFSTVSAERVCFYKFINFTFSTITAKIVMKDDIQEVPGFLGFFQSLNMYYQSGVIPCMFIVLMGNLWSNPILNWFDPVYLMKKRKIRKLIENKIENHLTQEEAHEVFQGVEPDIEMRYGTLASSIMMTVFYTAALPNALLLIILCLFINYWLDKYIFYRRISVPNNLGANIVSSMMAYLEWLPFLYSTGAVLFYLSLRDGNDASLTTNTIWFYMLVFTMIIGFVSVFIPTEKLIYKLLTNTAEDSDQVTWHKARLHFLTDYGIENPVTKKRTLRELEKIKEKHIFKHSYSSKAEIKKDLKADSFLVEDEDTKMLKKFMHSQSLESQHGDEIKGSIDALSAISAYTSKLQTNVQNKNKVIKGVPKMFQIKTSIKKEKIKELLSTLSGLNLNSTDITKDQNSVEALRNFGKNLFGMKKGGTVAANQVAPTEGQPPTV